MHPRRDSPNLVCSQLEEQRLLRPFVGSTHYRPGSPPSCRFCSRGPSCPSPSAACTRNGDCRCCDCSPRHCLFPLVTTLLVWLRLFDGSFDSVQTTLHRSSKSRGALSSLVGTWAWSFRLSSICRQGALLVTYTILGFHIIKHSIMGPKTLLKF